MDKQSSDNLPVLIEPGSDGFYDTDDGRLIRGAIKKCDTTQQTPWRSWDGGPDVATYLVAKTLSAVQRWQNQKPIETVVETPEKPLPRRTHELDELDEWNAAVPRREWEIGPDGKPRGPWQRAHFAYLVNPETFEQFTVVGGSIGMEIAIRELRKQTAFKRRLSHTSAFPLVRLETRPFKTAYGLKSRPHFEIVGWANDNEPAAQLEHKQPAQLEHEAEKAPAEPPPAKRATRPHKAEPPPWSDNVDEQPLDETRPRRERLKKA
jgi:hypothetical protein